MSLRMRPTGPSCHGARGMTVCRNQTAPFPSTSLRKDGNPVHVKDYNGRHYNYQQNNLDRWLKRESEQNRPPSDPQEATSQHESWEFCIARKHGLLLPVIPDPLSKDQEVDTRTPDEVKLAKALGTVAQAQSDDRVFAATGKGPYAHIGAGSHATVFSLMDNAVAVKVHTKGTSAMENEAYKHVLIAHSLSKYPSSRIRVPKFRAWFRMDEEQMDPVKAAQVKWYCDLPAEAMLIDRILPLRKEVRDGLIQAYAPAKRQKQMSKDRRNVDCLIHLYLGNCSNGPGPLSGLRDFKMNLTMMDKLRVPFEEYASSMGQALATMHWDTCVDARGIKFVLGTAPIAPPEKQRDLPDTLEQFQKELSERTSRPLRADMFCLDFDLVEDLCDCQKDCDCRGDIDKAVEAFKASPPYFPRPNSANPAASLAWNAFVMGYLESTRKVLGEEKKVVELGVQFLERIMRDCPPCTPDDVMKDESNPFEDDHWPGN